MTVPAVLPDFLPAQVQLRLQGAQRVQTVLNDVRIVWHVWGDAGRPCGVLLLSLIHI